MEKHPPVLEDIYEPTFVIILVITMKHCPIWRTTTSWKNFHKKCEYGRNNTTTRCSSPQTTWIKFIRNAPRSLRWFRSDLSQDNIDMLRSERSENEFV